MVYAVVRAKSAATGNAGTAMCVTPYILGETSRHHWQTMFAAVVQSENACGGTRAGLCYCGSFDNRQKTRPLQYSLGTGVSFPLIPFTSKTIVLAPLSYSTASVRPSLMMYLLSMVSTMYCWSGGGGEGTKVGETKEAQKTLERQRGGTQRMAEDGTGGQGGAQVV